MGCPSFLTGACPISLHPLLSLPLQLPPTKALTGARAPSQPIGRLSPNLLPTYQFTSSDQPAAATTKHCFAPNAGVDGEDKSPDVV